MFSVSLFAHVNGVAFSATQKSSPTPQKSVAKQASAPASAVVVSAVATPASTAPVASAAPVSAPPVAVVDADDEQSDEEAPLDALDTSAPIEITQCLFCNVNFDTLPSYAGCGVLCI